MHTLAAKMWEDLRTMQKIEARGSFPHESLRQGKPRLLQGGHAVVFSGDDDSSAHKMIHSPDCSCFVSPFCMVLVSHTAATG